jgi:hypothetical protein
MKRPWSVTFLTLGVLTLTGAYLVRSFQTVRQWEFLAALPLTVSPWYLLLSGIFWGLAGLVVAAGLWRGSGWAPRAARGLALAFSLYYWGDRLLLADRGAALLNWPFRLGATLLLLGLVFWILSLKKARTYFGEKHD